jgi:hypothetical protein
MYEVMSIPIRNMDLSKGLVILVVD